MAPHAPLKQKPSFAAAAFLSRKLHCCAPAAFALCLHRREWPTWPPIGQTRATSGPRAGGRGFPRALPMQLAPLSVCVCSSCFALGSFVQRTSQTRCARAISSCFPPALRRSNSRLLVVTRLQLWAALDWELSIHWRREQRWWPSEKRIERAEREREREKRNSLGEVV